MGRGIQKALTTSGQQVLERYRALAEVVESTRPRARGRARNCDRATNVTRSDEPVHGVWDAQVDIVMLCRSVLVA